MSAVAESSYLLVGEENRRGTNELLMVPSGNTLVFTLKQIFGLSFSDYKCTPCDRVWGKSTVIC